MNDTTYGTDRGPACACGGTIYSYFDSDGNGMHLASCHGCHGTQYFRVLADFVSDAAHIREIRAAHETHAAQGAGR